jgi:hypothetical protein
MQTCPRCSGDGALPIHTTAGPPPPCHLCRQSGKVGPTAWLVSPWGFVSHAFFGSVSAGSSEAVCTHSAPSARLVPDDGTAQKCQACMMIVGTMLAARLGDRDLWVPPGER